MRDSCRVGCAMGYACETRDNIQIMWPLPDEDLGLIDILGLDWLRQWGHTVVALVRIPVTSPSFLPVLSEQVKFQRWHSLVSCDEVKLK